VPAVEAARGAFGEAFLQAIDRALEPEPARRPMSNGCDTAETPFTRHRSPPWEPALNSRRPPLHA